MKQFTAFHELAKYCVNFFYILNCVNFFLDNFCCILIRKLFIFDFFTQVIFLLILYYKSINKMYLTIFEYFHFEYIKFLQFFWGLIKCQATFLNINKIKNLWDSKRIVF